MTIVSRFYLFAQLQKSLFEGLGLGAGGSIQVDFKTANGRAVKTATVKAKGNETETLPLYSDKDTVTGEVRTFPHSVSRRLRTNRSDALLEGRR